MTTTKPPTAYALRAARNYLGPAHDGPTSDDCAETLAGEVERLARVIDDAVNARIQNALIRFDNTRDGVVKIAAERMRQLLRWSRTHDREQHGIDGLTRAAAHVLHPSVIASPFPGWDVRNKPWDTKRRLAVAGAFIAAAIDADTAHPPRPIPESDRERIERAAQILERNDTP